jgi:hypothetical protein
MSAREQSVVKQDIEEAVAFMPDQSNKQVAKKLINSWHAYKYKKIEPTGKIITPH